MLAKRCLFCGLYIKFWQRAKHETWHAESAISTFKLLCKPCTLKHHDEHEACGKFPECRCICNAWGQE